MCDRKNLFSFSKLEGTVAAHSSQRIIITFLPLETVNYYERIFCIVKNHKILYLDLIGTSYDILSKPLPLMQRHVDIFRHKVIMGIHNRPVRKAITNQSAFQLGGTSRTELPGIAAFEEDVEINLEIPIDDPNQTVLHKEMMLEMSAKGRDVTIRENFLDFGFCEYNRLSEVQSIAVANSFPFDIEVKWVLLEVQNSRGETVRNPFRIEPS